MHAMVDLRCADHLNKDGPLTTEELAARCKADPVQLGRVLRMAAALAGRIGSRRFYFVSRPPDTYCETWCTCETPCILTASSRSRILGSRHSIHIDLASPWSRVRAGADDGSCAVKGRDGVPDRHARKYQRRRKYAVDESRSSSGFWRPCCRLLPPEHPFSSRRRRRHDRLDPSRGRRLPGGSGRQQWQRPRPTPLGSPRDQLGWWWGRFRYDTSGDAVQCVPQHPRRPVHHARNGPDAGPSLRRSGGVPARRPGRAQSNLCHHLRHVLSVRSACSLRAAASSPTVCSFCLARTGGSPRRSVASVQSSPTWTCRTPR